MIAAMSAPLVTPAWRTRAVFVCVIAVIAFALLAALVAGSHSTGFDDWMFRTLFVHTGNAFAIRSLRRRSVSASRRCRLRSAR